MHKTFLDNLFNKNLLVLLTIFLIGTFLRFYRLDKIPNSISADEAAFGYNAYSLLKTGRDEFGYRYPLSIKSFDDYKNPVLSYAMIPFLWIFGLSDYSIRLVSALSGIFIFPLVYLITNKLFKSTKLSLVTTLLVSISPWFIQYSRVAVDMNIALLFALLGVWLFLKATDNDWFYVASFAFLGISFYSYHSSKVWVPFIALALPLFVKKLNIKIAIGMVLLGLMSLPYLWLLKTTEIGLRPKAISVFSDQETLNKEVFTLIEETDKKEFLPRFFHNRRFIRFNQSVSGYLTVLDPSIYFGQNNYNQIPATRLFFIWQAPLLLIGTYALVKKRKISYLLLAWIIVGLLPGALTLYPPFDRRVFLIGFPLILFIGYGLHFLTEKFRKIGGIKILFTALISISAGVSVFFYLHNYFIDGRHVVVDLWGNGMKQVIEYTKNQKDEYKEVLVSLKLNQTLTFFLFYEKYPPQKYLDEGGTIYGGYLENGNRFDKYQFKFIRGEDWKENTLYVWEVHETQECLKPIKSVTYSDGEPLAHIGVYDAKLPACVEWNSNNS